MDETAKTDKKIVENRNNDKRKNTDNVIRRRAGAAERKAEKESKKAEKKGKKKSSLKWFLLLFFILLLVILAAGGYLVLRVDFYGIRTMLINAVNSLDPGYVQYQANLTELESRKTEASDWEARLKKEEERLAKVKSELDAERAQFRQAQIDSVPIYRSEMTDQELADMKALSKIYAAMNSATAANILSTLYDIDDAVAILYYMSTEQSAGILSEMDVRFAAKITELLLR